jgi:hypothetical protein
MDAKGFTLPKRSTFSVALINPRQARRKETKSLSSWTALKHARRELSAVRMGNAERSVIKTTMIAPQEPHDALMGSVNMYTCVRRTD